MDRLRGLLRRLRAFVRSSEAERELNDELAFHIEMETSALIQRGHNEADARRQARHRFGAVDRFGEEARDARGFRLLDEVRQDVRVALRLGRRNPQFTVAAVLTLGIGIGASTAIFSVVDAVLLGASPFEEPDRLVMIWETDRASETAHEPASWPDIVDMQQRSRTLSAIGGFIALDGTLTGAGSPERVSVLGVTPELPSILGVAPLFGRTMRAGDGPEQGATHALLGEEYWRRRFHADERVIGTRVLIDGRPTEIIGVMPAAADLGIKQVHARADYSTPFTGTDVDVWLAFEPTAASFPRQTHPFLALGRLTDSATRESAQRELAALMTELEQTYPENTARGVNLEPYSDVTFGAVRPALLILLAGVLFVLLIASVNVANLLLARTAARTREVAVRRALGAHRARVSRQFLVEGLVLAAAGAVVGVFFAYAGVRALVAIAPTDIPRLTDASIDTRVLLMTMAVMVVVAIGFGMAPLVEARRIEMLQIFRAQSGRRTTDTREHRRFRNALVVAQVALAVTLVISASLVLRSFQQLLDVDPGFRAAGTLKAEYALPEARYPIDYAVWPAAPAIHGFHARLLERVRALPGVTDAAIAARHPLDAGFTNSFVIIGREAESEDFPEIRTRFITPGYLKTLGVSLRTGRDFSDGDVATAPPIGLLNEAAVARYFNGSDPIGQMVQFWGVPRRIIGIISDERFNGVAADVEPAIYAPMAQAPQRNAVLLVRTESDVVTVVPELASALHELDGDVALHGAEPLDRTLAASIARPRFTATLLGLFGAVAMVLALIGVHGVLSYTVAQRTSEVGIRMALGATRTAVVGFVLREGALLTLAGLVIGVAGAALGSRLLAGILFGVRPHDVLTYTTVAAAVLTLALLASWLPARRAARAHPMDALRAD
jgi:predicted permease